VEFKGILDGLQPSSCSSYDSATASLAAVFRASCFFLHFLDVRQQATQRKRYEEKSSPTRASLVRIVRLWCALHLAHCIYLAAALVIVSVSLWLQ
jgi:hypothetical protein